MFKLLRKAIKWTFRLVLLILIVLILLWIYHFLINGITGQAESKCKTLATENGGANDITYNELADWLKTQSTSIVTVKDASYQTNQNQIVIKYSLFKNFYSGTKKINATTLAKYCGQ